MDGMSEIRNEIEQRLGVFARPGAKAAFGSKRTTAGALRKQLKAQGITDAADLEWHGISASDPDSTPYWLHEDGSMEKIKASRKGSKSTMGKYWVEDGQSNVKQPVKSMREGIQLVSGMQNGVLRYADHGMTSILAYGRGSGGASLTEDGKLHQKHASARDGAKATFAFPGIVVKEDAQYIYYYPDEDDRATFADADGKGAYTVKSNRTGKPVSAKTYRSWDEAVSASNAMNEKLPPLKKRKGFARPGAKATFQNDAEIVMREARQMHNRWKPIAERDQNKPNAGTRGGVEGYASSAIHFLENHIRDLKKYSKRADKQEAETAKAGLKEVTAMLKFWEAMYDKVTASRPGAKAAMAMTPIRVTEAEYAALAARDAVSRKILGDSQYQITPSDRTVRAAGDAAYKAALARHNAWDKAWRDAPNDAARAEIEARTEAAEAGMRVYRGSRFGAKAKFAITKEQIRGASREELRSIEQRLTALAKSGDKNAAALLAYVEEEYNDRYRGTHSRPGAKAAMAKFKVGDRVAYKPHPANTVGELVEIRKPTSLEGVEMQYGIKQASGSIMWVPEGMLVRASRPGAKATAAKADDKTECADCETEQDKAGLKLMEKADKAVSDKIRTLIKEGKPQDQAVAIALDMKRRGEL